MGTPPSPGAGEPEAETAARSGILLTCGEERGVPLMDCAAEGPGASTEGEEAKEAGVAVNRRWRRNESRSKRGRMVKRRLTALNISRELVDWFLTPGREGKDVCTASQELRRQTKAVCCARRDEAHWCRNTIHKALKHSHLQSFAPTTSWTSRSTGLVTSSPLSSRQGIQFLDRHIRSLCRQKRFRRSPCGRNLARSCI